MQIKNEKLNEILNNFDFDDGYHQVALANEFEVDFETRKDRNDAYELLKQLNTECGKNFIKKLDKYGMSLKFILDIEALADDDVDGNDILFISATITAICRSCRCKAMLFTSKLLDVKD